jgi:5-bromo-4-chloroindolyl phosphate hydrolysis protein
MAKKESILPGIVGGILGGVLFILLGPVMKLGIVWSLAGAAAGLVGGFLIAQKEPSKREMDTGISDEDLESTLALGQTKVRSILRLKASIYDLRIQDLVESMVETTEKILQEVKRDPTDVPAARYFLQYYLESTESLLHKYLALKNSGSEGSRERGSYSIGGEAPDKNGRSVQIAII